MRFYEITLKNDLPQISVRFDRFEIGCLPFRFSGKTFMSIEYPEMSGCFRFWEKKRNDRNRGGDWTAIPDWIEKVVELT